MCEEFGKKPVKLRDNSGVYRGTVYQKHSAQLKMFMHWGWYVTSV